MKQNFLIALFIILASITYGQNNKRGYFQGYVEEVSGKRFGYHSPIPDVNTSLLIRGQEDYSSIKWKSESVPENYPRNYVTFIWLYGMDVSSNPSTFKLSVNDKEWFSFSNSKTSNIGIRKFQGEDGAELTFNVTMLDKYEDHMGFAILKLPVEAIKPGEQNLFKISTNTFNNDAWFMTFKTTIEKKIDVYQNKVVAKKEGKLFHSISVDFINVGEDAEVNVVIEDSRTKAVLKAGFNKMEIDLPKASEETTYTAEIQIGDRRRGSVFRVRAARTDRIASAFRARGLPQRDLVGRSRRSLGRAS